MIRTIRTVDIYIQLINISGLSTLIELYSAEPTEKKECYGWISITDQKVQNASNKGHQTKEARVSIHIIAPHQDIMTTNEEDYLDSIIDLVTQAIVDEGCSKIKQRGGITPLYCTESNVTPMFFTASDRAYKIKDFLIGYES